jgi:hypothetical protein
VICPSGKMLMESSTYYKKMDVNFTLINQVKSVNVLYYVDENGGK